MKRKTPEPPPPKKAHRYPSRTEKDERVKIDADPEDAMKALLTKRAGKKP